MRVVDSFLPVSDYGRSTRKLKDLRAVVLHWTGAPGQRAQGTRSWFAGGQDKSGVYASAHYIIDIDGVILRCVPEDEVCWHVGSSRNDPASGRLYTDWTRRCLAGFTHNPVNPNYCTVGIEMCVPDKDGTFTDATVAAAEELVADIVSRHGLVDRSRDVRAQLNAVVATHHQIVGWKDCPLLWSRRPELFEQFKNRVSARVLEAWDGQHS